MKYKEVSFIDLQKFRLGYTVNAIESFWEEIYSKMPKNVREFYNSNISRNNSISNVALDFGDDHINEFGKAVPYIFTVDKEVDDAESKRALNAFLNEFVIVVDWVINEELE
ncbi:MAG: hypothetical protein Q9M91_01455 [Candidatus Dojkabacteria bacterium]|nr:hypothetical protein [Candidatus Dojkabacteria bacterium]MDQ7020491.1 hypothetical protein [Candidatus Dojkabacteria bacterium]